MSFVTYFNEMARPLGSKKLSPDLIKAINVRIAGGDTFAKIANDFFLSPWLVKKIADSQGVTHPRGRRPGVAVDPEKIENIMRRIESGEKYTDIARDLGVSRQYISKLGKEAGYTRNIDQQS